MDFLISVFNTFVHFGVWQLPWWGYLVLSLALTHVTIACVTIFLHRAQAHHSVALAPATSHFMRFWLWLTTGMVTKEWVAIHRKHHNKVETEEDPHSPRHHGLATVLFTGTELYRKEAVNKETLSLYGQATPDDWWEKNLYSRFSIYGVTFLLFAEYLLLGVPGIAVWAVQMLWIPLFAAGVVNGVAHAIGYRNFSTPDDSTNFGNIGLLIGGEELHNNHHAYPGSAKLSVKPWEFDIGWLYIRLLELCGQAKVKRVVPIPDTADNPNPMDLATVKDLFHSRLHVMAEYMSTVMGPVFVTELKEAKKLGQHHLLKGVKKAFLDHDNRLCANDRNKLKVVLSANQSMNTVYEFKHRLQLLWQQHRNNHEKLKDALHEWCSQAEASGMEVLQKFATRVQGYALRNSLTQ